MILLLLFAAHFEPVSGGQMARHLLQFRQEVGHDARSEDAAYRERRNRDGAVLIAAADNFGPERVIDFRNLTQRHFLRARAGIDV